MIQRLATVTLAAAAVLSLAACGEKKTAEPAAKPEAKPEASAPAKPAPETAAKPAPSTDDGGVTTTVVKTEEVPGMAAKVQSEMPTITDGGEQSTVVFVGTWAVTDSNENIYNILVFGEGKAVCNFWGGKTGPKGDTGTYQIDGTKCTIKYQSGWTDILSQENGSLIKYGYAPGVATDGTPTNQSQAQPVGPPMEPFVGVWRAELGDPFGTLWVALKSDGTCMSSQMQDTTGTWHVDDTENTALVTIGNGGPYFTLAPDSSGDSYTLKAWESGAPRDEEPTATAPAVMPGSPTDAPDSPPANAAEGTAN